MAKGSFFLFGVQPKKILGTSRNVSGREASIGTSINKINEFLVSTPK